MARTPLLGGSFATFTLLAAPAAADAPVYPLTWSQEALAGVEEIPESPELRTLRMAEEELFGRGSEPCAPNCAGGEKAPAAGEPPARLERAGGAVELSFLRGLKLPGLPVRWDPRVIEYLLFFKDDPRGRELAGAWLKRQERYGPMLRRVLTEYGLPADLQYVAMIESGYDPLAHSDADAFGLWQFVKEPAEHYGLRVDHWADERLDPERAAHAAARFFRDLYQRFGGWELSLAAYNMGYGGLLRAIRKYNSNDYWLLSHLEAGLPFETALYVAKITAMAIVAHNPARFGFDKLKPEPSLQIAKIDAPAGTPLHELAKAAGISLEQLQAVNSHLKRGRVPPGEPSVQLYVPREAQVRFVQNWSKQRGALPIAHTLRHGETLEELARRARTSAAKLRALNELAPDSKVEPGFALLLPGHARPSSGLVEPLVATVPAKEFRYPGRRRIFYRVAPDDSARALARLFEVSLDELTSWNSLSERAALQPGMLLQLFVPAELDLSRAVVFTPDEVRVLTVGSDEFFDYHEAQRGRVRVRYRAQPRDTLASVAARFQLSTGSIGRINQFPSDRALRPGEWVIVYVPESELEQLAAKGAIERIGRAREGGGADEPAPAGALRETPGETWAALQLEPDWASDGEPASAAQSPAPKRPRGARPADVGAAEPRPRARAAPARAPATSPAKPGPAKPTKGQARGAR